MLFNSDFNCTEFDTMKNILFVMAESRKLIRDMDRTSLVLIGHSNSGDMVMLIVTGHPDLTDDK